MAHVAVIRHHIVGNISEDMGGEMVRGFGERGRIVGGLVFS